MIVDESHAIKNTGANMSRATCALHSGLVTLVSGTPVNQTIDDLCGQLKCLGVDSFSHPQRWAGAIGKKHERFRSNSSSSEFPVALLLLLRKLMVRHEKAQLVGDPPRPLLTLPPKTESTRVINWPAARGKSACLVRGPAQKEYMRLEAKARALFMASAPL